MLFVFFFSLFPVLQQRTSWRRAGHFRFGGNKGIVRPCRFFVTSAAVSRRISFFPPAKCSASSLTGKTSTLIVHHRTLVVVNGAGKTEGAGLGSSDSTTFPPVLTATVCALLDQSSTERSLAFLSWIGHDIDEQHSETQKVLWCFVA